MIPVTTLDGTRVLLNADLLQQVEQTPDTLLVLVNGERLMVRETPDELIARIVEYKRATWGDAHSLRAVEARTRTLFTEAHS